MAKTWSSHAGGQKAGIMGIIYTRTISSELDYQPHVKHYWQLISSFKHHFVPNDHMFLYLYSWLVKSVYVHSLYDAQNVKNSHIFSRSIIFLEIIVLGLSDFYTTLARLLYLLQKILCC